MSAVRIAITEPLSVPQTSSCRRHCMQLRSTGRATPSYNTLVSVAPYGGSQFTYLTAMLPRHARRCSCRLVWHQRPKGRRLHDHRRQRRHGHRDRHRPVRLRHPFGGTAPAGAAPMTDLQVYQAGYLPDSIAGCAWPCQHAAAASATTTTGCCGGIVRHCRHHDHLHAAESWQARRALCPSLSHNSCREPNDETGTRYE